ncbi:dialkylrecorsinol condensing enzyme DarA [Chryseobacterium sp.]|uniref:dialkylrecorsinol condensing enzyme DarA n=1 Tax=Chryseobacterium sp. TaxID=1871047 RepID=UPI0011CB8555|nr:dialkylrecorsinol condensing enzyme DarA [Chryseobacterium sp.]TXF75798.1 dialkylresorcinol condensing enzyme DarA [Chryseobacterium sp.]
MPKNILFIYYSQTGQLEEILKNISKPFEEKKEEYAVTFYEIKMKKEFAFPWKSEVFFNTFPETFRQIPSEILSPPEEVLNTKYDLIIFGYQVWYLSPSIPINSFLKSIYAKQILQNTPLVTVSGSRNMWAMAQEKLKILFKENGAKLVGNIALTDRHDNYTSVITILRWLMTGDKEKTALLPKAGIADEEIAGASKFGVIIRDHLETGNFDQLQPDLVKNGAVEVRSFLIKMDRIANKMFRIWSGKIITKHGESREKWVKAFSYYLFFAIWVISPIALVLHHLITPVFWNKRIKQKKYFQGISNP